MIFSGHVVGARVLGVCAQRGCSIYTICEVSPQALRRAVVKVSLVSADWGRTSKGSRDTRGLSRLISVVASR